MPASASSRSSSSRAPTWPWPIAQVTAIAQVVVRQMPPGITPPLILQLQRRHGADPSARPFGRGAVGAEPVRPRHQHGAPAAGHRARPAIPWPYGGKQRQVQIDLDRRRCRRAACRGRRCQRAGGAEHDRADRHAEDRRAGVHAGAQQRAFGRSPTSATCRSRWSTAARSISATWPTCATATRRRPASCTSMARVGADVGAQERRARRWAIVDGIRARLEQIKASWPDAAEGGADQRSVDLRARRDSTPSPSKG